MLQFCNERQEKDYFQWEADRANRERWARSTEVRRTQLRMCGRNARLYPSVL